MGLDLHDRTPSRRRDEMLLRHDDRGGLVRVERAVIVVRADGVERYPIAISTGGTSRRDASDIEHAGVCGGVRNRIRVMPVH